MLHMANQDILVHSVTKAITCSSKVGRRLKLRKIESTTNE